MISVLTYNHPHRKTQDVLFRLKASGYEVTVIATPWEVRKNFVPLFVHRPSGCLDIPIRKMCKNLGYEFHKTDDLQDTLDDLKPETTLIAGAGIIKTKGHKIINSHPGYLPYVRGLDALKWAILRGHPIGVTTYYISEEVDKGDIIDRQFVRVEPTDDFYTLSMRVYEREIGMLIDAIGKETIVTDDDYIGIPTRRMPHRLEVVMMDKFERLKY